MYLTYTSRMMECRRDGYEEGLHTGLTTGREEAYAIGITTGREQDISIGLEQGREQGAYQNKLETARNLLTEGLVPQVVTRCTTLPLETVLELAQEL